jgi:hypothetical protein
MVEFPKYGYSVEFPEGKLFADKDEWERDGKDFVESPAFLFTPEAEVEVQAATDVEPEDEPTETEEEAEVKRGRGRPKKVD